MGTQEGKKSYKDTLNLPRTDFSIRANAKQKESELLVRWQKEDLYRKTYSVNKGGKKYVMHDGPPYANANIHLGLTFNKIFKDIICKFKRMSGWHVPFKPGWDCHGLPIELKIISELSKEKSRGEPDSVEFKKACRQYASKWIEVQEEEFKQLGVLANWDSKYFTMNPTYEAEILRAFSRFVEGGYIERKLKTVPWCYRCKTVLAAAEIEYRERKDPSIYIFFPFSEAVKKKLFSSFSKMDIGFLVWTTTPWTIPLNRAVVLHPSAGYLLLQGVNKEQAFIVATDLADRVCSTLGIEKNILKKFKSSDFKKQKVKHPFVEGLEVPILLDSIVTLDEGTACIHMAPGCGPEDYILAIKNGLEIYSPLSPDGKYTSKIEPKELESMSIDDAQIWVIKKLAEVGRLVHKAFVRHSYPHCWRCRNGLMFRATKQWFCNLRKNDLLNSALQEIEKIKFVPESGKVRLRATVNNREEWCISRQRRWGVPIPALFCQKCEEAYLNSAFIKQIADRVEKEGVEVWDKLNVTVLIKENLISKDLKCFKCGNSDLSKFKLERDILDVWFDSGISHFVILKNKKNELAFPADLYVEGSDQHRGWFQSSLLSSMVLNGVTPTKTIITHGFVVDAKGHKMSKSLGNVVSPHDVIKNFSVDILRLWAASLDYEGDVVYSNALMRNVAGVYRKIRNTCKFLLSNLYDFDFEKDAIAFNKMLSIDQFALAKLCAVDKKIFYAYEQYDLITVFQTFGNYCANDLSSFYLDIAKDRLYTEKANGLLRRSAQTVCYHILDTLTRLMAPILSFLAEEISDNYQKNKKDSIHLQHFSETVDLWGRLTGEKFGKEVPGFVPGYGAKTDTPVALLRIEKEGQWLALQKLRDGVLKALEEKREEKVIRHSLEAKVTLYLDKANDQGKLIETFVESLKEPEEANRFFKDLFIVSQIKQVNMPIDLNKTQLPWVYLKVEHADGVKCPRCWQWDVTKHPDGLCRRCEKIV